jgi:hypothetical protein
MAAVMFMLVVLAAPSLTSFASNSASPGLSSIAAQAKDAGNSDNNPPAPASIGADVPLTYFGPSPSQVQKELVGPYQLLKSGQIDTQAGTITLPLYQGRLVSGEPVWYILTDTNDKANADALGLNFSSKLTYAAVGRGVRHARQEKDTTLTFLSGKVDFTPEHKVTPGETPNAFPPKVAEPGSVGDENYSPLVQVDNLGNTIYNAPIVAFGVTADQLNFPDGKVDHKLVHDKVVKISPKEGTVTLGLTTGFSFAKPILYLSTEANDPAVAALEGATYAPALKDITTGHDDSAFSAVERLFTFTNGPTGKDNPQRQGLSSALQDGRSPLNVFGGIPTVATDYSPLWDLNVGEWTKKAIDLGYRSRLTEEFAILGFVQQGWITGPGGSKYGSSGFIVNCPPVFRFL